MVTHTFTNGTTADADQVNQNFIDVEERDGFTFFDNTSVSESSLTTSEFRNLITYTINKEIDGLYLYFNAFESGSGVGTIRIQVNNNTPTEYIPISAITGYWSGTQYNTDQDSRDFAGIFINQSLNIGDTISIDVKSNGGTITSYKRLLQGVKNKTTDNTWVSVA